MSKEQDPSLKHHVKICKEKIDNATSRLVDGLHERLAKKQEEISDLESERFHLQMTHSNEMNRIRKKLQLEVEKTDGFKTHWETKLVEIQAEKNLKMNDMRKVVEELKIKHIQELKCLQAKIEAEEASDTVRILQSRFESQSALIAQLLESNQNLENELCELNSIKEVEQLRDKPTGQFTSTCDKLQISTTERNLLAAPSFLSDNTTPTASVNAVNSASPPNEVTRNEEATSNCNASSVGHSPSEDNSAVEVTNFHEITRKYQEESASDLTRSCVLFTPDCIRINGPVPLIESDLYKLDDSISDESSRAGSDRCP